jgi:hypothetical protein
LTQPHESQRFRCSCVCDRATRPVCDGLNSPTSFIVIADVPTACEQLWQRNVTGVDAVSITLGELPHVLLEPLQNRRHQGDLCGFPGRFGVRFRLGFRFRLD